MADEKPIPTGDEELPDELPLAPESIPREEEESIQLVETGDEIHGEVRAFGSTLDQERKVRFQRPVNLTGQGAVRCRIFHSKIAVASLEHLEHSINEWLDGNKVEIKHVGHVIGIMEGKRPEPNLLVMVWY